MFSLIMDAVQGILGNGLGMLRDHLEGKRKAKQAELETKLAIEKAKVESAARITEGQALHEIRWSEIMAEGSKHSWKDEWFAIILSLPFLLSMFGLSEWADRAFAAMAKAPDWYTLSFMVAVGSSFGVRIWQRFKKNGNGKNGGSD